MAGRRGYSTEGDVLVNKTADGIDLNVVWDQIKGANDEWNRHTSALVSLLTFKTTTPGDAVPQASSLPAYEVATEMGVARSIRQGAALPLGYDLQDFDLRVGWTWKFVRSATRSQVLDLANTALASDQKNQTEVVLNRLFDPSVGENENATPVYGLWNGSGAMVPPARHGSTFDSTHNHYLVSGSALLDSEDIEVAYHHLAEHGYGLEPGTRVIVLVSPNEADVISSFRAGVENNNTKKAKHDFIPSSSAPPYLTDQTLVGDRAPDKLGNLPILGSYGRAWIAESPLVPPGYVAAFATGGANAKSNVIGYREWPQKEYQGLRIIPGLGHPLIDAHYTRAFGVGVRQRGGAVVMQIAASGPYQAPDISA